MGKRHSQCDAAHVLRSDCRRYLVDLSEVDGIFGPITRNRVIRYQLDRSVGEFFAFSFPLAVDGIVGPMTWSRLTPPLIKKGS